MSMTQLPWTFIWIGVLILSPEFLWWFFNIRPKNKKIKHQQKLNDLFWRIRDLEKDVFGEWRSQK